MQTSRTNKTAAVAYRIHGFTYLGVLFLLALLALLSVTAIQLGAVTHKRASEEALLEAGAAYGQALRSYRLATPVSQPDAPKSLQDLLRDPRFPAALRHLRQLYPDPVSGQANWGTVIDEDTGGIVGVFSRSNAKPLKIARFDDRFPNFDAKTSYQDWKFMQAPEPGRSADARRLISPGELAGGLVPSREAINPTAAPDNGLISPGDLPR